MYFAEVKKKSNVASFSLDVCTLNGPDIILSIYRVAQEKRNNILPTICGCNNWYHCMRYLLLRKMIPRSLILVQ